MRHRLLFASAGVIALMVAMFALAGQPAAHADTSSVDWDVAMSDAAPYGADAGVCPSNGDDKIDVGECMSTSFTFVLDTATPTTSDESFFDVAPQVWQTGPPGADLDGDTLAEPSTGIMQFAQSTLTHATTVARGSFTIKTNIQTGDLAANNIDDVGGNYDSTVVGQPPVCGGPGSTGIAVNNFPLWKASTDNTKLVAIGDDELANNYTLGQDCSAGGGTPDAPGIADGVDCVPDAIPVIETAIGLPLANLIGRAYGVSMIAIVPGAIYQPSPVNFLVFNMVSVPSVQGYVSFNVVNYPGVPASNPLDPGYDPLGNTVGTCPPFTLAPLTVYGIGQDSDLDIPTDGVIDLVTPNEKYRQLVAGSSSDTFNFDIYASVGEDWDGDTIANHYDRCQMDPNSGTAAQDIDGDGLTGLCENPTGMTTCVAGSQVLPSGHTLYWNCEGNNPQQGGSWNITTPWDTGQDVDQDGWLNYNVDNCPNIPDADVTGDTVVDYQLDRDADQIGDVCEMDLASLYGWDANAYLIPGDGSGYPGASLGNQYFSASPGKFVDRDSLCRDPFVPTTAEPGKATDTGRSCLGLNATAAPNVSLGRQFADSNDDSMPDLLDHPAGGAIEWADTNSDTDLDGHSDACEAFVGSDPLDPSSVPGAPSVAGDCDNDGTGDASDADPFTGLNPDADRDGCARSEEQPGAVAPKPGSVAAGGVSFQDQAWYDFYDVPVPSLKAGAGVYSKSVTMGDVLAVLNYVGEKINPPSAAYTADANSNGIMDGVEYDRTPSYAPNPPWDAGPPNGSVTMADVLATLAQVGLKCTLGTHF